MSNSLILRKAITKVMCFPNEARQADSVGVPVDLDQEWSWEQCVEAMADAMGLQGALSADTRVFTATGFEIDNVSSCIQGETVHIAWEGEDFFETALQASDIPVKVAEGSSTGSEASSRTTSTSTVGSRRFTDLRRGSELDGETASTRLVMKFIVVGSNFVGKSCLLEQFANKQFPLAMSPTLGVDYNSSIIKVKNTLIKIQVWDTAGQEEHRAITRAYFRNSAAAIVVYDVTNQQSFDQLGSWIEAIRDNGTSDHMTMALCGNKIDLTKAGGASAKRITTEQGQAYARSQGMLFFETSAKEDTNVGMMFRSTARDVLKKIEAGLVIVGNPETGVKTEDYAPAASRSISAPSQQRPRKKCC